MQTIAVALYLISALGVIALGLKYMLGPVPAAHHAQVLAAAGIDPAEALIRVLKAVYTVMGGAMIATGVAVAAMAWFGVRDGVAWASWAAVIAILAAGLPSIAATWSAERATGVRTPWRAAVLLSGLGVLGFALSLI